MTGNASPLDGMGRVCIDSPSLWVCATADLWLTRVAPMPAASRKKPTRDKCFVSRDLGAELFTIRLLRFDSLLLHKNPRRYGTSREPADFTSPARICRRSAWCAHLPPRSACAAGE